MTIALRLATTNLSVLVLESGGLAADAKVGDFNKGKNIGQKYFPLEQCRRRYFGGSSNCWAGWCAPFSTSDFEHRPWLPNSDWPITFQDIAPYYEAAAERLQLKSTKFDAASWTSKSAPLIDLPPFLESKVFLYSPPTRFGERFRDTLKKSKNVHCLLNATCAKIVAHKNGQEIDSLVVRHSLSGESYKVRAKAFILAAGGLENPRLMLNSTDVHSEGLGNKDDNVGRYFMEHPHLYAEGRFFESPALPARKLYTRRKVRGQYVRGYFRVRDEWRKKEKVLDLSMCIGRVRKGKLKGKDVPLAQASVAQDGLKTKRRKPSKLYFTDIRAEQAPNRNSRITLSDETDKMGLRRIKLNWALSDIDHKSAEISQRLLGRALGANGMSRLKLYIDSRARFDKRVKGGCHHMGTTRMSADAKHGVVDANCQVHGIENLYVAGSSIFTTSSAANPTLTLVAFAERLAEHLKEKLT